MPHTRLEQIYTATANELLAGFEAADAVLYGGGKGTLWEEQIRAFLTPRVPGPVSVIGSAEIVSSNGDHSGQCDILVVDPGTPPFLRSEGHQIVPSECVYAVIEVKSRLTTSNDLLDACESVARAKRLEKLAFAEPQGIASRYFADGRWWPYQPTAGFIVAYDSKVSLDTLCGRVADWCGERPLREWPDAIFILTKGTLTWGQISNNELQVRVQSDCALLTAHCTPPNVLMMLMMVLYPHCAKAWSPPFRLLDYLGVQSTSDFGTTGKCYISKV